MTEQLLRIWLPLTLAGTGGAISYRAGVLNIALEGFILIGAFTMIAADFLGAGFYPALLLSFFICALAGFFYAVWSVTSGSNIFIAGLGMNLIASGGITTFSSILFGGKGVIQLPRLAEFSTIVRSTGFNAITGITAVVLTTVFLYYTPAGIATRAAGSKPELLKARGSSPELSRILALVLSCALSGLAGALLALRISAFVPHMSANRGWIALVLVFLGRGNPAGVAVGALVYSGAEVLTSGLQGTGLVPESLLLALPYFITALFLVVTSMIRTSRSGKFA